MGQLRRLNLSVRGGAERFSFYVSGDIDDEEGVFFKSFTARRSLRANFTVEPSRKFDFLVTTNLIRNHLRLPLGDEAGSGLILSAMRGQPGRAKVSGPPEPPWWRTATPEVSNRYNNQTRSDRVTAEATLTWRPFDWFIHRLTLGLDYTSSLAWILYEAGTPLDVPEGLHAQRVPRTYVYTADYAVSARRRLPGWNLESTTSFGVQYNARRTETLFASGTGLGAPDVTLIGTAARTQGANAFSENKSLGYYLQEQLGYADRLFVTAAVRADDNSAFGENFDIILYPKASLSWVLSEEPWLQPWFDRAHVTNLRVRLAWGQAGRAPDPYVAVQTYTVDRVTLAPPAPGAAPPTGNALRTSNFGNPDLRPERGTEWEAGFDAEWFDGRLGMEFTYYDKRMRDLIQSVPVAPSTGFAGSQLKNIGATKNTGIEAVLTATPVLTRWLRWESRLTASTNRNVLVSFGDPTITEVIPGGQVYSPGMQRHRVGRPLAAYYERPPLRNPDGTFALDANGAPVLDTLQYIGPAQPTRQIGWGNTLTLWSNLRLYVLLDHQGGHYLFNYKEYNRCQAANSNCWRVNDPVILSDPVRQRELVVWRTVRWLYVEPADFVKLREVSLTYTLPSAWARRFGGQAMSVTVAGRNLAQWTRYSGIDPEVNTYGLRNLIRVDAFAAPSLRRLSASLNVSFERGGPTRCVPLLRPPWPPRWVYAAATCG